MVSPKQKFAFFVDDLKTSWYFRVWFSIWFVLAILSFSCLIILGSRSTEAAKHEGWRLWIEHADKIEYPSFCFRTSLDETSNEIGNIYCQWNGIILQAVQCEDGTPRARCVQLNMAGDYATKDNNNLVCSFGFNVSADPDKIIGFEIVKAREFGVAFTWIQPNSNAWILLSKYIIKPDGEDERVLWGRQLVYHSTVQVGDFFQVSILIDTFRVFHYVESDYYNGWMALGDVGGFAFFMYILHTIVMFTVGVFLENNSKFLNSGDSPAEYQQIK